MTFERLSSHATAIAPVVKPCVLAILLTTEPGLTSSHAAPACEAVSRRQRMPRDKADVVLLAVIQYLLAFAIDEVVLVLHGHDLEVLLRSFDVIHWKLAKTDMPDETFALHG